MERQMVTAAPEFVAIIQRGLAHWGQVFTDLPESAYGEVAHKASLARTALELGLQHPETLTAALNLLVVLLDPYIIHHARPSVWIPLLHLAEKNTPLGTQQGKLLCRLYELYALDDQLDTIEPLLNQAEEIGQIDANADLLSWVYLSRADWHFRLYHLDAARECVVTAKQYIEDNGLHDVLWSRMAGIMNMFGRIAHQMGHWEEAIDHYHYAYQLYADNEQLAKQAIVAHNMANTYVQQGDYVAAEVKFVEATLIHHQCQNQYYLATLQSDHVQLYDIREEWGEAYQHLSGIDQAYLHRAGVYAVQGYIQNNLGYYATKNHDIDVVEHHYREAIRLWHIVDNEVMRANSLGYLSIFLWEDGDRREARQMYEEARDILNGLEEVNSYVNDCLAEFQAFWRDKEKNEEG